MNILQTGVLFLFFDISEGCAGDTNFSRVATKG